MTIMTETEKRTASISTCLRNLGPNYKENIDQIIALSGDTLQADEVSYVRIEGKNVYEICHWGMQTESLISPYRPGCLGFDLVNSESECAFCGDVGQSSYGATGIKTCMAQKVISGGVTIGVLFVNYIEEHREYTPADEEYLRIMASVIASEENRRTTRLALYERDEKYTALAEASRTLLWEIDMTGIITFVNRTFDQFGYTYPEVVGKHFNEFMDEETSSIIQNMIGEEKESLIVQPHTCEIQIRAKNGKIHWLSLNYDFLWKWGTVAGWRGIATDITERKHRELRLTALKEATEHLLYEPFAYQEYLEILGRITGLERMALFLSNPNKKGAFTSAAVWRNKGVLPPIKEYREISCHDVESIGWSEKLFVGEVVIDPAEALANVEDFGQLDPSSVEGRTIIIAPLFLGDFFEGFIVALGQDLAREDANFLQTATSLLGQNILRNRMASRVAQSEEQLRQMTDNALDIIFSLNENGDIIYVNPAVERILGYTREEALSFPRGIYDLLHAAEGNVAEGLANGKALDWPMPIVTRSIHKESRQTTWLEIQAIRGQSSSGEPLIEGIARDVTAKVKTDLQLREQERRYRAIIEHTNLLAVMINSKGNVTYANSLFLDTAGYSPEEVLGKPYVDFFVMPEKKEPFKKRVEQVVKTKIFPPVSHGFLPSRKSSDARLIEWNNTLLFGSKMEVVGLASVGIDITVRHNAEMLIQESESKYRTLVQNLPVGICRTTPEPDGVFLAANPAMAAMLGYSSPEELMSYSVSDMYFSKSDRELFSWRASQGPQQSVDLSLKRKDGSHCYAMISTTPARDEEGNVIFFDCVLEDITEKKKAQDNLRQILDHMRTGVIITGHKLNDLEERRRQPRDSIVFFNWALREMTGYSNEDFSMLTLEDIVYPQYHENIRAILEISSMQDANSHNYEVRLRHKEGKEIWAQVRPSIIFWGDGTAIVLSFTEITKRKVAMERLGILHDMSTMLRNGSGLLSHEVLNNILSLIIKGARMDSGYVYMIGADGDLRRAASLGLGNDMLEVNPVSYLTNVSKTASPEYFYADGGELLKECGLLKEKGMKAVAVLPSALRSRSIPELKAILKDEGIKALSVMPMIQAGRIIAVFVASSHLSEEIPPEARDFLETATTEIGVYLSKEFTKKQLEDSEEFHRYLIENAKDWISILSNNAIVYVNHEFAGYERSEFSANNPFDLIPAEDRARFEDSVKKVLDKGETVQIRHRLTHKEGFTMWMNSSLIPIKWENQPAVLNYMRDINELKKFEDNAFHSEKMNAIGTLAGGMAHDFNNVLMGIQGHTGLMLMKTKPSQKNYTELKMIEQLVESGSEVTRQLLGFARGGMYEPKPLNISDFLDRIIKMYSRTKREIVFHQKVDTDVWQVHADKHQMEQVFMNLFVNAAQAMPAGGDLYVDAANLLIEGNNEMLAPGSYVKISVTDTGVGMDDTTKDRIFEPFFTSKEMGRGTGLGLATVYGIIRNHGGQINVYSSRGQGTTFNIYLPASVAKSAKTKEKEPRQRKVIPKGNETILVIDDEPKILNITQRILEELGYKVLSTIDGKEGVRIYRENKDNIDLVLLDMIMPDYSGEKVFNDIHKINPNVRVLLASGYSENGLAKSILAKGCLGFMQKPYGPPQLSKKVREILAMEMPSSKATGAAGKKTTAKRKPKKTA